jgi:hypothetical protein
MNNDPFVRQQQKMLENAIRAEQAKYPGVKRNPMTGLPEGVNYGAYKNIHALFARHNGAIGQAIPRSLPALTAGPLRRSNTEETVPVGVEEPPKRGTKRKANNMSTNTNNSQRNNTMEGGYAPPKGGGRRKTKGKKIHRRKRTIRR